jgi:hypothetical protein
MDATRSTLLAMKGQEQVYAKHDYLRQHDTTPTTTPIVDEDCRSKMVAWSYQVVDYLKFQRETVEISMNSLDRYMATADGRRLHSNTCAYQLAAMTCLYTAVKIHEPEAMDPQLVSNLSRGTYSPTQIEHMEVALLQALDWRVNPPTALAYCRLYLDLISVEDLDPMSRTAAYESVQYQTELAVNDYDCMLVPPSTVAYCALVNALQQVGVYRTKIAGMAQTVANAMNINATSEDCASVQEWLHAAVVHQQQCATTNGAVTPPPSTPPPSTPERTKSRCMSTNVSPRAANEC